MPTFTNRLKHAWNAFTNNKDPTYSHEWVGNGSYLRPDRVRLTRGNERSIITAIENRIALDVASMDMRHVKMDDNDRYVETVEDELNNCLTLSANIDQTGRAFIHDGVLSMFDEGCVALVPTQATQDPTIFSAFDIGSLRTGKIIQWYPQHVRVSVYNEQTGRQQELVVPKRCTAIIENPFYAVMNESNSVFQRLIRKLNLLDAVDEQTSSGKLDLIIQLPYTIKTDARREQAERRRHDIEMQLSGSKYGIAYTDGTEHITQLNRAVENNLMGQIEYLTSMLYGQLGITASIIDGTADEKTMLNYYTRTVEPIASAFAAEMTRKFLTKNARTRGESIMFFRDQFSLVPAGQIASIAQTLVANEIATPNEIRALIGWKPADDAKADELGNRYTGGADSSSSGDSGDSSDRDVDTGQE